MGPWGGQISKHCWVNPFGLTRVVFASSLGCCPEMLHWGSFLRLLSKEKSTGMAALLSCGFTQEEVVALGDEGIVGGCCCSCSPSRTVGRLARG